MHYILDSQQLPSRLKFLMITKVWLLPEDYGFSSPYVELQLVTFLYWNLVNLQYYIHLKYTTFTGFNTFIDYSILFNTFIDYILFKGIIKSCLHFPVLQNISLWFIYFTHGSSSPTPTLPLSPSLCPLVSTSLFSVSQSLFLFCYIHLSVLFF